MVSSKALTAALAPFLLTSAWTDALSTSSDLVRWASVLDNFVLCPGMAAPTKSRHQLAAPVRGPFAVRGLRLSRCLPRLSRLRSAQRVLESAQLVDRKPSAIYRLRQCMIVVYARVNTFDQILELQRGALERAGCERVYEDHIGSVCSERPGRRQAHTALCDGDTLVVWRLDRLGRSLKRPFETVLELDARGVGLKSLTEIIDTTTRRTLRVSYLRNLS